MKQKLTIIALSILVITLIVVVSALGKYQRSAYAVGNVSALKHTDDAAYARSWVVGYDATVEEYEAFKIETSGKWYNLFLDIPRKEWVEGYRDGMLDALNLNDESYSTYVLGVLIALRDIEEGYDVGTVGNSRS